MTTPTVIRRKLTVHFQRAISMTDQVPETVEVVVIPLSDSSLPEADATYVGGLQKQTVVLSQEDNTAVFDLVPTDEPGLTDRILYRIAWRQGVLGRTFTYDFAMPDVDVSFKRFPLGPYCMVFRLFVPRTR